MHRNFLKGKIMTTYDIKGNFYEACDCEVICSCWAEVDPDMGSCTGLFVWEITAGNINGVSAVGDKLMVITSGISCSNSQHTLVLIDIAGSDPADVRYQAMLKAYKTSPWSGVVVSSVALIDDAPAKISTIYTPVTGAARATWSLTAIPKRANNHPDFAKNGSFIVGVNSEIRDGITLTSANSTDLAYKVVGQSPALKIITVGVARSLPTSPATSATATLPNSADGLNILADMKEPNPSIATYNFDLDISDVTVMKGEFRYVTP
jgi:Protein of unknown function (DUF1326)